MAYFKKALALGICLIVVLQCDTAHVFAAPSPPLASHYLRPPNPGGPFKERVIVFVHGLLGDADNTWRYSSEVYWPELLLTDHAFDDSDVYVVNYHTQIFGNMTVEDIVSALNNQLTGHQVFSQHREVVFVCHSFGGIVIQRLLLRYRDYAKQVPFIYFFATPETGSQLSRLGTVFSSSPLLESLISGSQNEYLQVLDNDWKGARFTTHRYCAYENRKFMGVIVVDRLSGTRDCDDVVAIDEDHQSIVKPSGLAHASYIALRNAFIANPLSLSPDGAKKKNTFPGAHSPTEIAPASTTPKDNVQQSPVVLQQSTSGWCSPAIANVSGGVTVNCIDVDPRALSQLNADLSQKNLELSQKIREANDWAERYHELEKRLSKTADEVTLSHQAEEYLHEGELEKAGAVLDEILGREEKEIDLIAANHYNRGLIFQLQFRPLDALPHLKAAYQYRPSDLNFAQAYAALLLRQKDYQSAEPVLDAALDRLRQLAKVDSTYNPDFARVLNNLAVLYRETGRSTEAEIAYKGALEIRLQLARSNPGLYQADVAMTLNKPFD